MNGFRGLFLDVDSVKKLVEYARDTEKSMLAKTGRLVNDPHITFCYGDVEQFPEALNSTYTVYAIGYGEDDLNSGFQVEIPEELKSLYDGAETKHITLFLGEGGKAVDTAYLRFHPLKKRIVLKCRLGIKPHGGKVIIRKEEEK